jgi:hypothetical protein
VGAAGITVATTPAGVTTITGTGGGPTGLLVAFVDREVVAGGGTSWTLANAPDPTTSLQLYQELSGFGGVLLVPGVDYSLAGATITTINTIAAGNLFAWYRVPSATPAVVNFVDGEIVAGTGTAWYLAYTPNPTASLLLFQQLSGFGNVLLSPSVNYTIAGSTITTMNSLPAGSLRGWYRF